MDDYKTLREYQEYLLAKINSARSGDAAENILLLGFVSAGVHYLIEGRDVLDVHQISKLEPIPLAKPWAAGVANIKGSVYAVVDFALLHGAEKTKRGKYMVVAPEIVPGAAILIEGISGLFDIKDVGELSPTTNADSPQWLVGSYQLDQKYFMVDTMKLANDVRFSTLQSGDSQ